MPNVSRDLPRWYELAACRGANVNWFYPDTGESAAPGLAFCAVCPVWRQCRSEALSRDERYGIWAGMTPKQRRRLKNQKGIS